LSAPIDHKYIRAEYFWRDAYKNEVDVILFQGDEILPIEIKYSPEKPKPLLLFMKKFKCERGVMLTYDTEMRWGAVEAVPFYKYFLGEKTMEDGT
jgi:predicted AAA+ superfamily ATPase